MLSSLETATTFKKKKTMTVHEFHSENKGKYTMKNICCLFDGKQTWITLTIPRSSNPIGFDTNITSQSGH